MTRGHYAIIHLLLVNPAAAESAWERLAGEEEEGVL
jgi:hypothetical protein